MTNYIALLRAVNVMGTGGLPMAEVKALCEGAGFAKVRTSPERIEPIGR